MTDQAVLGYWKIRGMAGQIRLALDYCGEDYRFQGYDKAPSESGICWSDVKWQSGMIFPNIPHLDIDGYKLTQTKAILKYIGRKHGLVPKNEEEHQALDQLQEALHDFSMSFGFMIYHSDKDAYEKAAEKYKSSTAQNFFKQMVEFLGDKKFAVGDHVTYIDFTLFEYLDVHREYDPGCLDAYPTLKAYVERFSALPKIAATLASDRWIQRPVFSPHGHWR